MDEKAKTERSFRWWSSCLSNRQVLAEKVLLRGNWIVNAGAQRFLEISVSLSESLSEEENEDRSIVEHRSNKSNAVFRGMSKIISKQAENL